MRLGNDDHLARKHPELLAVELQGGIVEHEDEVVVRVLAVNAGQSFGSLASGSGVDLDQRVVGEWAGWSRRSSPYRMKTFPTL